MSEPQRRRLPEDRDGVTKKASACGFEYYATVNFFDDGTPGEAFITIAKRGSTVAGFAKVLFVILSVALQYGIPWEVLYRKLKDWKFEPNDDEFSSLISAMASTVNDIVKKMKET